MDIKFLNIPRDILLIWIKCVHCRWVAKWMPIKHIGLWSLLITIFSHSTTLNLVSEIYCVILVQGCRTKWTTIHKDNKGQPLRHKNKSFIGFISHSILYKNPIHWNDNSDWQDNVQVNSWLYDTQCGIFIYKYLLKPNVRNLNIKVSIDNIDMYIPYILWYFVIDWC